MKIYNSLIAKSLTLIIAIVSIAVLIGWIIDIDLFKILSTEYVTMKVPAALMFLFTAILNWSMLTWKRDLSDLKAGIIGTSMMSLFIFSIVIIADIITKPNLGFIFLTQTETAVDSVVNSYPSIITMVLFCIQSIAGLYYIYNTKAMKLRLNIISKIFLLLSGSALIGHLLNIPQMYYYIPEYSTAMSFHSSILFFLNFYILRTISFTETTHNLMVSKKN